MDKQEIRRDPSRYAVSAAISPYVLDDIEHAERVLQYQGKRIQTQLGEGLVDAIWRNSGLATVQLDMRHYEGREPPFNHNIVLEAQIQPATTIRHAPVIWEEMPLTMRPRGHFEWFPMDWVCEYCGGLIDGRASPRKCPSCGGTKPRKYW